MVLKLPVWRRTRLPSLIAAAGLLACAAPAWSSDEGALQRLAETDPLTWLFNRRHFDKRLEAETNRALRAELARVREQRDILKKSLGILSEPPRSATKPSTP